MTVETHLWFIKCWSHAGHNVHICIFISWIHLFKTHSLPSLLCCSFHRWGNWVLKELSYLPKVKRIVHVTEEVFESVNEKSAIGKKKKKKRVGGKLMEFSRILKFYWLSFLSVLQVEYQVTVGTHLSSPNSGGWKIYFFFCSHYSVVTVTANTYKALILCQAPLLALYDYYPLLQGQKLRHG